MGCLDYLSDQWHLHPSTHDSHRRHIENRKRDSLIASCLRERSDKKAGKAKSFRGKVNLRICLRTVCGLRCQWGNFDVYSTSQQPLSRPSFGAEQPSDYILLEHEKPGLKHGGVNATLLDEPPPLSSRRLCKVSKLPDFTHIWGSICLPCHAGSFVT